MPRGSDAAAAGAELKARTGMTGNAEDFIQANQARWSKELRAANKRPIDHQATRDMDEGEAAGYVEGDRQVLNYAVRGPFVVVVSEDEDTGEIHKEAFTRKGQEKQAERATRSPVQATREERREEHRERVEQRAEPSRRAQPRQQPQQ